MNYIRKNYPLFGLLFVLSVLLGGCIKEDEAPVDGLTDASLMNSVLVMTDQKSVTFKDGKAEPGDGNVYEIRAASVLDVTGDEKPEGLVLVRTGTKEGYCYDLIVMADSAGKPYQITAAVVAENLEVIGMTTDSVTIELEVTDGKSADSRIYEYQLQGNALVWVNDPEKISYRLVGTEPFWAVVIENKTIKFMTPAEEEMWPYNKPEISGITMTWKTVDSKKRKVVITLTEGECSDGMSELVWDYKGEVSMGTLKLNGCGKENTD